MTTATKYPGPGRSIPKIATEIPILKPEQMHKGAFDGPNNTHCLLGHRNKLRGEAWELMNKTMRRMLQRSQFPADIMYFNDRPSSTKEELAAFWNKARRRVIQNAWRKRQ